VTDKLSLINTLTSCPECGAAGRFKLSSTARVGRYEFEQVTRDDGFYQVRTIPYGVAGHPLHALRVYAEQRGASPEFMDGFIEEVETELPGPFLLLDPHEAAPASRSCCKNATRLRKKRKRIMTLSILSPATNLLPRQSVGSQPCWACSQ
jgi:hypothetical protein